MPVLHHTWVNFFLLLLGHRFASRFRAGFTFACLSFSPLCSLIYTQLGGCYGHSSVWFFLSSLSISSHYRLLCHFFLLASYLTFFVSSSTFSYAFIFSSSFSYSFNSSSFSLPFSLPPSSFYFFHSFLHFLLILHSLFSSLSLPFTLLPPSSFSNFTLLPLLLAPFSLACTSRFLFLAVGEEQDRLLDYALRFRTKEHSNWDFQVSLHGPFLLRAVPSNFPIAEESDKVTF